MNKKVDKKLSPFGKVVIILAVIGATIVATGVIKADRDVSAMIENSKLAEIRPIIPVPVPAKLLANHISISN